MHIIVMCVLCFFVNFFKIRVSLFRRTPFGGIIRKSNLKYFPTRDMIICEHARCKTGQATHIM